jgi:hypothetical protein
MLLFGFLMGLPFLLKISSSDSSDLFALSKEQLDNDMPIAITGGS